MYHISISINNEEWRLEDLKSPNLDAVKDAIINEVYCELASEICSKNPAFSKVVGADFTWNDLDIEDIYSIIDDNYENTYIDIFDEKNDVVATYSVIEIYKDLISSYLGSENSDIEICNIWSNQLQNFIDNSKWQIALTSDNKTFLCDIKDWPEPCKLYGVDGYKWIQGGIEYNPIMWFGPEGDELLEEWIIQNDGIIALVPEEKGMGSYGGQLRIQGYEINYLHFFEGNGSWYFGACGNSGADFYKLVESCPIDLLSIYSNKNGFDLVKQYCLKTQNIE